MKHSFTIYRDDFSAVGVVILMCILPVFPAIFGIISLKKGDTEGVVCCLLLAIAGVFSSLIMTPRAWVRVTFTDEGVYCKTPYKKAVRREYRNYPYILRGYYFHGTPMRSIGAWRDFIVLTNRRYSDADLHQINLIESDDDTIIIKNTSRNRRKLCAVLPPNMRNTFIHTFSESLERGRRRGFGLLPAGLAANFGKDCRYPRNRNQ